MGTESTEAVYALLRTHLLAFEGPTGASLSDRLGQRLYIEAAPDSVTYPHGVMRFLPSDSQGAYNQDRQEREMELHLYDRPRSRAALLSADADLVEQAMIRFRYASNGLVFSRGYTRVPLPVPLPGMERDIVTIRFLIHLVVWPTMITDYATS